MHIMKAPLKYAQLMLLEVRQFFHLLVVLGKVSRVFSRVDAMKTQRESYSIRTSIFFRTYSLLIAAPDDWTLKTQLGRWILHLPLIIVKISSTIKLR